jgi:hypothetical protein
MLARSALRSAQILARAFSETLVFSSHVASASSLRVSSSFCARSISCNSSAATDIAVVG